MSDVGDLLELLHGAGDRWTTFEGTVRTWHHLGRARIASDRWIATTRSTVQRFAGDTTQPQPETHEWSERLWIAKPDRVRREGEHHTSVQRGRLWWSWSEHSGYVSNEDDPDTGHGDVLQEYAAHLDPAVLIPRIDVERIVGLRVHVRPRPGDQFGPGLPPGADRHVLELAETGVVLRIESLIDGEPFFRSELADAVWDVEPPDETFTLEVPPGEEIRSPRDVHWSDVTIEEAAAAAGFAVFTLPELPDGHWRASVFHHRPRQPEAEAVTILYHRADAQASIHLTERPSAGDRPWARVHGGAEVTVERDGTAISLSSQEYDEEALRELAETLVRV